MVMQSGFDGSGEEKTPIIMRIGRDQRGSVATLETRRALQRSLRGEFIDHKPVLDLCVSSLRMDHTNLLCIVPILSDVPEGTYFGFITWSNILEYLIRKNGLLFPVRVNQFKEETRQLHCILLEMTSTTPYKFNLLAFGIFSPRNIDSNPTSVKVMLPYLEILMLAIHNLTTTMRFTHRKADKV
ncbi:LOW QUALITY PROTEIN: hypothetical protein YC2023_054643 [Brassica napus]